MIEPPRADSEELDPTTVHRRAFLASCGVLAAALSGCSYVFPRTRLGRLAVNDPHPEVYRPVLRALLSTMLPFDHPDFPSVSLDEIEERLLRLFPVERQDDYAAMQRALVFFDAVDLLPQMHVPLVADERNFFGASRAEVESYVAEDRRGYDSFVNPHGISDSVQSFISLTLQQRSGYLELWAHSAFGSKRRFYRSIKSLIMITCYSLPAFWQAIQYAVPVLDQDA